MLPFYEGQVSCKNGKGPMQALLKSPRKQETLHNHFLNFGETPF